MRRLLLVALVSGSCLAVGGMGMGEKMFHDRLKPVRLCNPMVPEGFAALIERCLMWNANKRPERMSQIQGELDELADEAAAKINPADLEE